MAENLATWISSNAGIVVSVAAAIAILWKTGSSAWRIVSYGVLFACRFPDHFGRIEHASNIARTNTEILLNRLSVATWESDASGKAVSVNRTFTELTGWTLDDIRGSDWHRTIHPDDLERVIAVWTRTVQERTVFEMEYRWRTRWGTDIPGRAIARWHKNGKDYITGAFEPTVTAITKIQEDIAALRHDQQDIKQQVAGIEGSMSAWLKTHQRASDAAHKDLQAGIAEIKRNRPNEREGER